MTPTHFEVQGGCLANGACRLRDLAGKVEIALVERLVARGVGVTCRDLTTIAIPDCKGDFGCWTVTPGVCVQPGPHRDLAREVVQSDLVVALSPITFGGYSSGLKRLLDHMIPLITNWFTTLQGETHHVHRYRRFPAWLAVGLEEAADPQAEEVFSRLVLRNALNFAPGGFGHAVVARRDLAGVAAAIDGWLDLLATGQLQVVAPPLDLSARADLPRHTARRTLLLTGSPRGENGTSGVLAAHLAELLSERGVEVVTRNIQSCQRQDRSLAGLADAVQGADAVALLTPLYVDSLPGPVTEALERLAPACGRPGPPVRFLAVVNSGFPEAVHNDTALAMCRRFAAEAGLEWMGGLAVGGGGMYAGRPLRAQGGRAVLVRQALSGAADAVARGGVLPDEAQRQARRLPIPNWLYRAIGNVGFWRERRGRGTLQRPDARPYENQTLGVRQARPRSA